jgi:hypothetical protein
MILRIKEVEKCRNGAYGNYRTQRNGQCVITISISKNQEAAEWAATVLHELLHFWVTLLRVKSGHAVSNFKEHRFIYAVEAAVAPLIKKWLRRKK